MDPWGKVGYIIGWEQGKIKVQFKDYTKWMEEEWLTFL